MKINIIIIDFYMGEVIKDKKLAFILALASDG